MRTLKTHLAAALSLPLLLAPAHAQEEPEPAFGHSAHGSAFDEGPRTKPWKMDGIGDCPFPITTSHPEVQDWFNQGNALLHNFWWFEAERAFRWCLKLDPECAMAYWGLARATSERGAANERMQSFIREAVARKDNVTERERRYIEAWAKAYLPEYADDPETTEIGYRESTSTLARELELMVLDYPDDVEAKALYALAGLFSDARYGNEAVIREILAVNPEHPAAHHYRIHTWDGKEGAAALDSCEAYGRVAWYSGHANHMPGHIYSGIGMWHEGAIWMDSATRVEKAYMQQRMTLPYHNWNYAHNRNYLSFIQEQLGLPTLAIDGARQLLAAPRDPEYNPPNGYGAYSQGRQSLIRALIKFERWDEILDEDGIRWEDTDNDKRWRAYAEALAHLQNGDIQAAVEKRTSLSDLGGGARSQRMLDELAGRIAIARGQTLEGVQILGDAAHKQWENYREENDPPSYPYLLYTVLGEIYLEMYSPGMAAECFEKSISANPNDAFALSGLTRARYATGDHDGAREAYGRLLFVWSDAEPGLRWMEAAADLNIDAEPIDDGPRPQRNYREQTLDHLGPETWRPYAAPELAAINSERESVTLAQFKGKNVLLVFYLGEGCAHCVEQLQAIDERKDDFISRNVELLAISSDSPDDHATSEQLGDLPFTLLSDEGHENARRFHAYDDFEELELHATILIDADGKIRWARTGGDPFMDMDFLVGEIDRVNELTLASDTHAASSN